MSHTELSTGDRVRQVLGTVLGRHIAPDEDFDRESESAWDSLKHVELLFALEDALGIRFDEEELQHLGSVRALVESVSLHLDETRPDGSS